MAKRKQSGWDRLAQDLSALEGGQLLGAADDPLLERVSAELLVFSADGLVVDANERACRGLGYDRDELGRLSIWDLSTRQTPAGFQRLVESMRETGHEVLFGHNRRKDGSSYPVEARLWTVQLDGVERIVGYLRDAGPFEGLIEERDQLIDLIESSADAIVVTAPDGTISYMNQAGLEMVGAARPDDVVGRSIEAMHDEDEREQLVERILPELARRRWQGELTYVDLHAGGSTPCLVNAFALRQGNRSEVTGFAFLAHDISRRKEAERKRERIRDLNEVSRRVATSLLEHDDLNRAIAIILQGVGGILDCCRAFLCRYRDDRQLLFRTHEWDVAEGQVRRPPRAPEPSEPYERATEVLLRGEVIRIGDVSRAGLDLTPSTETPRGGALLREDVKAILIMPVIIRGRLESFFGFVDTRAPREWIEEEFALLQIIVDSFARAVERRIAERERALVERDLERAVERERLANRYKSDFLASMSHELRTPMNAIVGYAELLGRPNADEEHRATWIENIQRSTDHLLSLINDVLDLSKIEAGQMTLDYEDCDLMGLVSDVVRVLEGAAAERLLNLVVELRGDVPELVHTDPVRFKQILLNLVGNAVKYTESGGVRIRLSAEGPDDTQSLRVAVIDTGVGIAPDELAELFRPFARLGQKGAEGPTGTGLGLDIARQLARLFGGEIEVQSRVGVGSTFTLLLPLRPLSGSESIVVRGEERVPRVSGAGAVAEESGDRLRGTRFLVVDDSRENREVLRFLLKDSGASVEEAENGALGVKAALDARESGRAFDVVLMDVNMPVLDGLEATKKLRRAGYDRIVIALTAMTLAEDSRRCLEAGADDYIAKPVVPRAFLETVARHARADAEPDDGESAPDGSDAPRGAPDERTEPTPDEGGVTLSLAGNPRFAPLIERYLGSFPSQIEAMRAQLAAGEFEALRTSVHRLRGTAANYGYPELTELAGACEDAIRTGASGEEVLQLLTALCERMLELST